MKFKNTAMLGLVGAMILVTMARFPDLSMSASPRDESTAGPLALGPAITLTIPGSGVTTFTARPVQTDAGIHYVGHDVTGRRLTASEVGGMVDGVIDGFDGSFRVVSAQGRTQVQRINSLGESSARDTVPAPIPQKAMAKASVPAKAAEPHLDILLAYDPSVVAADGANYPLLIASRLQAGLDETFTNSSLGVRPRVVGVEELDPKLSSYTLQRVLDRLVVDSTGEDGTDPNVIAVRSRVTSLRTTYKADLLVFVGRQASGNPAGLAVIYSDANDLDTRRNRGVAVAHVEQFSNGAATDLLIHEIGHSLGAGHERGAGNGWKPYAHAYHCGDKVTATATGCFSGSCSGVLRLYSTPAVSNGGEACGVAVGQPDAADNSTAIRESLPDITGWYTETPRTGAFDISRLPQYTSEPNTATAKQVSLQITRTGGTGAAASVLVSFTSQDDPARFGLNNSDTQFTGQSQRVNFAAGEAAKTVTLSIPRDNGSYVEDRLVQAQLLFPIGADLGDANGGTMALLDADHEQGVIALTSSALQVTEGDPLTLTVTRAVPVGCLAPCYMGMAGFKLNSANGTASAGTDYTAVSVERVLATNINGSGVTQAQTFTVTVPTVNRAGIQGDRDFTVALDAHNASSSARSLRITIKERESSGGSGSGGSGSGGSGSGGSGSGGSGSGGSGSGGGGTGGGDTSGGGSGGGSSSPFLLVLLTVLGALRRRPGANLATAG